MPAGPASSGPALEGLLSEGKQRGRPEGISPLHDSIGRPPGSQPGKRCKGARACRKVRNEISKCKQNLITLESAWPRLSELSLRCLRANTNNVE
jgi:hypothetical protein